MYEVGDGKRVTLSEPACSECPVSLITISAKNTLDAHSRAHIAGTFLYGPNLSRWPAREVDASVIISYERSRADNARYSEEFNG